MKDGLQQALANLRREIDAAGPAEGPERERLLALVAQLESQLKGSSDGQAGAEPDADGEESSVLAPLREAVEQFESEHPKLTAMLIEVMRSLGGAGI